MSTILDALRKAKESPDRNPVDARREILRPQTHDYLVSAPDFSDDRSAALKLSIALAILVIGALSVAVVVLTVKLSRRETAPDSHPAVAQTAPAAPSPAPALADSPQLAAPDSQPATRDPQLGAPASALADNPQLATRNSQPATRDSQLAPAIGRDIAIATGVSPPPPPIPLEAARVSGATARSTPSNAPIMASAAASVVSRSAKPRTLNRAETARAFLDTVKLEGVMWDSKDPLAIVNGEIVKQGARIGKARVVRIQRDSSVVFEIDGKQYTVK